MASISRGQGGMAAGALLAGAVSLLALPSAVLAFTSGFATKAPRPSAEPEASAMPASRLAARLAPSLPVQSLGKGQMFRFTPAGNANRTTRSVTVAVRVDASAVRGILVRGTLPQASQPGVAAVQISPTAFNLGVSRGFHSFAPAIIAPADGRKTDAPDLGKFSLAQAGSSDPSRFSPRIVLDQKEPTGRAPRTFSDTADRVDLGGAYRLGRNIDVTAGVRYSQERDRLRPLTDGKKDNQAVYLGTQFRF